MKRPAPDPNSPIANLQKAAKRAKDEGDLSQAEKFAQAARDLGADQNEDAFKGVLRKLAKAKLSTPSFTKGEEKALSLLISGLSESQIAARLKISQTTVCRSLDSGRRKLGVATRDEAIKTIVQRKLFKQT